MKKLLSLLLIVISLNSQAQSLPDQYLKPIAEELIEKDGLVFKINYQDSLITIYKQTIISKDQIIATYKLSEEGYKSILINKDKILSLLTEENKGLKKKVTKGKLKDLFLYIGIAILTILYVAK